MFFSNIPKRRLAGSLFVPLTCARIYLANQLPDRVLLKVYQTYPAWHPTLRLTGKMSHQFGEPRLDK
jgi:hypothetical protein